MSIKKGGRQINNGKDGQKQLGVVEDNTRLNHLRRTTTQTCKNAVEAAF